MSDHLPVFEKLEHEILHPVQAVRGLFEPHHTATQAATMTPVPQPVNLAAALPQPQEETMSVLTELEDGWTAAKGELAKFEQALPGALVKAKAFEASPFALLAEKVASGILPPEAVTIAVNAANKVLDDLIGLYTPATSQPPAEAPAAQ